MFLLVLLAAATVAADVTAVDAVLLGAAVVSFVCGAGLPLAWAIWCAVAGHLTAFGLALGGIGANDENGVVDPFLPVALFMFLFVQVLLLVGAAIVGRSIAGRRRS